MEATEQMMEDFAAPVPLLLGVARLGEAGLRGWWRSHGLGQAGGYVLGGSFPRTWRWSGLELDVISAQRRHEQVLGRPTALHLFSDHLPFRRWATAWLAAGKTEGDGDLLDRLTRWDLETAVGDLRTWTGGADGTGEAIGGGLLLGSVTAAEMEDPGPRDALAVRLAAGYLDQDDKFRPPYLDLVP